MVVATTMNVKDVACMKPAATARVRPTARTYSKAGRALTVIHLLLLDGFKPFGAATGDGDPVFHQRFYQAVAISLPLVILRIPPVKRWIISKRASGQQWKVWLLVSVIAVPYLVGFIYIINEEILTGMMCLTMHPPTN